jgi:hypothetical protein
MFVRSRPSRTRRTISLSRALSGATTNSIAKPSAARLGRPGDGHQRSSGPDHACGPLLDVVANHIEHQVDTANVFQRVVLQVDELHRAAVERLLTVGRASGADDIGAELACELHHHRPDSAAAPCRSARPTCRSPEADATARRASRHRPRVDAAGSELWSLRVSPIDVGGRARWPPTHRSCSLSGVTCSPATVESSSRVPWSRWRCSP